VNDVVIPLSAGPQTKWTLTASGHHVWYLDPWQTPILDEDIFLGLREVRYNGYIYVNVLLHSCLCVLLARYYNYPRSYLPYVACHDLHEAYVKDITSAMKQVLPEYKERIELPWSGRVHANYGLDLPMIGSDVEKAVKFVDDRALVVEVTAEDFTPLIPYTLRKGKPDPREPARQDELDIYFQAKSKPALAQWRVVARALGAK